MKLAPLFSMFLIAIAGLAGCASPTRVAQTKTIEAGGEKFEIGGRYTPPANELILTINGDPVMRGSFPPTRRLFA